MFDLGANKKFRPREAASNQSSSSEIEVTRQAFHEHQATAALLKARGASNATKSSLSSRRRRIALALVTLSWSSLSAPLRSILNGFYYFAAIVSLLLLIAYFHQAKAQQTEHKMTREIEFLQSTTGGGTSQLDESARRPKPEGGGPRTANTSSANKLAGTKTIKRPSRLRPVETRPTSKRPTLPELTFRGPTNEFSENNRGVRQANQFNETQSSSLLSSSAQWTPILHQAPPRIAMQHLPAMPPPPPPPPPTVHLPPAPPVGHETRYQQKPPNWQSGGNQFVAHNTRHNHETGPDRYGATSGNRRTWRRPRLNPHAGGAYRQNKMYKRVLICDKTLVSLDYVREFGAEPRPFPMAHYTLGDSVNFVDDNTIDLELNGPTFDVLDRRASTTNGSTSTTTPNTPAAASPTAPAGGDQPADASSMGESTLDRRSSYQHNLLPDDDALVKCDMWDLEKGLKNRKPPADILELAVKADFDTVRDAINRCRQLTEKTLPPDDEYRDGLEIMSSEDFVSLFSMKRGLLPGTKWCGLGDQASTYNDLGPKHRIDICCRAHDHCPIRLKPFRNDYGVLNIALYTKSHCDCDADFYRCLREAHSRTADMLGNLYFNVMKLQCIREERLKVCREVRPIALGFERCVRYEENPMRRVFKFTTPPVAY